MSAPPRKPPAKGRPSLIDAARASGSTPTAATATPSSSAPQASTTPRVPARASAASQPAAQAPSMSRLPSRASSAASTPSLPDQPPQAIQKLKFKPKVPIRRVVKQEPDVKPDITAAAASSAGPSVRGGMRGRGRGGSARGRAPPPVYQSLPAGPFGGPRPAASAARKGASGVSSRQSPNDDERERYSDNDDDDTPIHQQSVIDIDQVSQMHESAPTSLYRDRKLNEKGGKVKVKDEKRKIKGKGKALEGSRSEAPSVMEVGSTAASGTDDNLGVKAEPISPTKMAIPLDPNEGVPPPGGWRDDDAMQSGDEEQDRDQSGRRVRSFAQTGGNDSADDEDVNEAQMVDLSESEEEEEEDDLTADFTQVEGMEGPENKLFMFQFPNLFPRFEDTRPVDVSATVDEAPKTNGDATSADKEKGKDTKPDIKPDIKPTPAQLRGNAKKFGIKPPEGRIGSLVVMKSGRVKMVLGEGIVMDVSPGVETTFLQQLVHLDSKAKAAVVLGEINKNYVVTPDIDRLLQDLFINGGQTPGDKEWEDHKRKIQRMRAEGATGLMKMEMD